jgi:pimeloyl-ACP methyl ester carboxylesterase
VSRSHPRSDLHIEELLPEDDQGSLVVLVHGSMDRLRSFARLAARLRACHVVGYDRRGYARSRGAGPLAHSVGEHALDLVDVLDGRQALLLGHSYGATVALTVAEQRPDLVRSVVAYEPPLPWYEWWHDSNPAGHLSFDGLDPGDAALAFVHRMVGDERFARMPERFRTELRKDGPAFVAEMGALRDSPAAFNPTQISPRVLVVRGSDTIARQVRGCDLLAAELPDAELAIIAGAGHGGHISHPDALAALVLAEIARTATLH